MDVVRLGRLEAQLEEVRVGDRHLVLRYQVPVDRELPGVVVAQVDDDRRFGDDVFALLRGELQDRGRAFGRDGAAYFLLRAEVREVRDDERYHRDDRHTFGMFRATQLHGRTVPPVLTPTRTLRLR